MPHDTRLPRYLARRLLGALALVVVVSSCALILARLAPGDFVSDLVAGGASPAVVAEARARYGLDRSLINQYADWLGRAARLDFGVSFTYDRPVGELVGERALNTALLAAAALLIGTLVGLPLGVVSGSARRGPLAAAIRTGSVVALSMPPLVLSLLLALMAARTGWFPVGGMTSAGASDTTWLAEVRDLAWHLCLPALALSVPLGATLERLQSQAMAEVIAEPYIASALARGVSRRRVVWRHALRPATRPIVALYGLMVGSLLSGSFAVEIVTAWPGLGRLMYDALVTRDLYLVGGCAAAGTLFLALGSLAADVALAAVDPRLRYGEQDA